MNYTRAAVVDRPVETHTGRLTPTARHELSHDIQMYGLTQADIRDKKALDKCDSSFAS